MGEKIKGDCIFNGRGFTVFNLPSVLISLNDLEYLSSNDSNISKSMRDFLSLSEIKVQYIC